VLSAADFMRVFQPIAVLEVAKVSALLCAFRKTGKQRFFGCMTKTGDLDNVGSLAVPGAANLPSRTRADDCIARSASTRWRSALRRGPSIVGSLGAKGRVVVVSVVAGIGPVAETWQLRRGHAATLDRALATGRPSPHASRQFPPTAVASNLPAAPSQGH
jgi:hypothetical protein